MDSNQTGNARSVYCRMEDAVLGTVLGHQMGQVSERRWWRSPPDGSDPAVSVDALVGEDNLRYLIDEPPFITTPGWTPTCFTDTVPHLCALGAEYARMGLALTPENFRDFLLREREWLRLQGVGRSCLELMAEGMNPRIAGLFAAPVVSGCWVAWPAGLCHAGCADDAYEDAVKLARTQSGGDIVVLAGLLAAMIATAVTPGSGWDHVRAELLRLTGKRGAKVADLIGESLSMGKSAANVQALIDALRSREFLDRVWVFGSGIDWLSSFYAAVAALEYAFSHDAPWPQFARAILEGCDSRFGAMIAFSIRTAIKGTGTVPGAWLRHAGAVHAGEVRSWMEGAASQLNRRVAGECAVAREILGQLRGDIDQTQFYGKVLAVMLAGAAGNAMGSPVEDRDYPWIEERYGVLDRVLEPGRLDTEDDSAMAAIWSQTYIRSGGRIYPEDLAQTFRDTMKPANFYYDTQHAYNLMMGGLPPHACGHWNVVTGSGLMGSYPCGIYHAGDPGSAAADALELAYHYQRGFDVHAPAILCAAAAEALRAGATVNSVLDAALNAAPEEPQAYFGCREGRDARRHLRAALDAVEGCSDVLAARDILYRDFLEYNGQDPWEVVTLTLAIFKAARGDIRQSMIGGTNIGRDSDTIASQAAVLSACLKGMEGLPQKVYDLFSADKMESYQMLARDMTLLVRARCQRTLDTARRLGFDAAEEGNAGPSGG